MIDDQLFRVIGERNAKWLSKALSESPKRNDDVSFVDIADKKLDQISIARMVTQIEQEFHVCLPLNTGKDWVAGEYRDYLVDRMAKPNVNIRLARERAGQLTLTTLLFWLSCLLVPLYFWYLALSDYSFATLLGAIFFSFFPIFAASGLFTFRYYDKLASAIARRHGLPEQDQSR